MTVHKKHGLHPAQGLTQTELAEIQQLAELCNAYGGLDLKLNWGVLQTRPDYQINDFLYYEHGRLIGFAALYNFNPREGEISGMVHPDFRRRGIFTALFQAVYAECKSRDVPELLLIVEHSSYSGAAFAQKVGAHYHHSEYKMVLAEAKMPASWDEHLQFRRATTQEVPILAHITAISFDLPERETNWYLAETIQDPNYPSYVGLLDGVVIGKLDVHFSERGAIIIGFGVLPQYRGRGYGRQMLAHTLQEIAARGEHRVELEVVTDNKNALLLYQSCGFKETSSYDYSSLTIPVERYV